MIDLKQKQEELFMTNLNVTQLLEELQKQRKEHSAAAEEIESLIIKQVTVLKDLLDSYKPVYQWYSDCGFLFKHPTLQYRSPSGLIMGYDNKENELYVFNIKQERVEKVNMYKTEVREFVSLRHIVEKGFFNDAVTGIKHLESMLKNYVNNSNEYIQTLKKELEEL